MEYKDYYKILGVERDATEAKIKSAYRKLARQYHPDVNKSPDAVNKFKDINEAYEVLSDKEKKARYDSLGANWQQGANFTPPPGFEGFNFNQGGFSQSFSNMGDFSDFFSSIFGDLMGGAGSAQRTRRTSSKRSSGFSYEDIFSGSQGPQMRQSHSNPESQEALDITQDLNITAKDMMSDKPINVKMSTVEKCTKCSGAGSICSECGGTGIVSKSRTLSVKIPKGVKEGQKIRLKGEGKTDNYGRTGDLYFIIKFKDNEYSIEGEDLTKNLEITPAEAVMGCKKDLSTLHGIIAIKIPAETRSGKTLRLKDLGLPKKSGGFGNLNVKIVINIPATISQKQKDLYKKLLETE